MKKVLIVIGIVILVLAVGAAAALYFFTDFFGEPEMDKDYLLDAIENTSDLDAVIISVTGSMADEKGSSKLNINSELINDGGKINLLEKTVSTNVDTGLVTKQYVKTVKNKTKYKIVQNEKSDGWQEKDPPIKSIQSMSLLAHSFTSENMDLIAVENDGEYVKFQIRFNDSYAEKMKKKHEGETYTIKEYSYTYWVNEEDIVVRTLCKQHIIYDDIDMTYEHDAKLEAYGEEAEAQINS